jgi:hypothetical protein
MSIPRNNDAVFLDIECVSARRVRVHRVIATLSTKL